MTWVELKEAAEKAGVQDGDVVLIEDDDSLFNPCRVFSGEVRNGLVKHSGSWILTDGQVHDGTRVLCLE